MSLSLSNIHVFLIFCCGGGGGGVLGGWLRLTPLGTSATPGILYQRQMMDDDECGAVGGADWQGKAKYS
jgi:hypothetical protein